MKVFVLGVGATGSLLAKLLVRQGHQVMCGDRDPTRARAFLGEHSTLVIQRVHARNVRSIVKAAKGCHLLVNACPAAFNKTILRAAIQLHSHYIDTASRLTQSPFRPEQYRFDGLFRKNKRLALIHAGVAPGLTNLLAMQAAAGLDTIERVQVRLFEETASDSPVSQWSADDSFDEAVSRPRIYRNGLFEFGKHFGERELFRFPAPIGEVGVRLAAQDEVVTIPHVLRVREMDAKSWWDRHGTTAPLVSTREADPIPWVGRGQISRHTDAAGDVKAGAARYLEKRTFRGGDIGLWAKADSPLHGPVGCTVSLALRTAPRRTYLFAGCLECRTDHCSICKVHAERTRRRLCS